MIQFTNVTMRYPAGHDALSNVSFALEQGEMAFLTGHSGAGKSTLLKLVAAIERCTTGQIVVNGTNVGRLRRSRIPAFRRELGIVFQDHNLLYDRSVYDNVALPLVIAGFRREEIGRRVRAALDKVGLLGRESSLPITLSTGEQQRVGIARAVVNRPAVLLADEPTGNLDPELALEVMRLFEEFNQIGTTVLVATHDIDLINRLGHRRLLLKNGRFDGEMKAH